MEKKFSMSRFGRLVFFFVPQFVSVRLCECFATGRRRLARSIYTPSKKPRILNQGMSFELITVCHPSADITKPALVLENKTTGSRAIIGNVPGGLQRRCNELKIRTGKLTDVYLTGKLDWESIAGLPGLILTVSDQGVKNLNIVHSGNNILQYMISCWRYFIFRFGLNLKAHDSCVGIDTENVTYTPVCIESAEKSVTKHSLVDLEKLKILVTGIFPIPDDSSSPKFNSNRTADVTLPKSISNPEVSANWIIMPNPVRGKFLVQKARELNVPQALYKILCDFTPVTLENGTVIKPEQVLEPTKLFKPILVLDIPSRGHLENVLAKDWLKESPNGLPYAAVYHFIDSSIEAPLEMAKYKHFIQSFDPSTTHFVSHKDYCPNSVNFKTTYRISLKWKTLLESFFPLGKWSNAPACEIPSDLKVNREVLPLISGQKLIIKSTAPCLVEKSSKMGTEMTITTEDELRKLYDEEIVPAGLSQYASREKFDGWISERNVSKTLAETVDLSCPLKDQVETLILGTGSALPSPIRNVISSIVRIPFVKNGKTGFQTIVLDAGEGSYGLLKRYYTQDEVNTLLDELSFVYLSHLHADHHLGIADILQAWSKRTQGTNKKLYLVTPWQFPKFLNELKQIDLEIDLSKINYLSCEEFNKYPFINMEANITEAFELSQIDIENVTLSDLTEGEVVAAQVPFVKNPDKVEELYDELYMSTIETCPAYHCEFAYSCALTFKLSDSETFKVSYSGDTRPRFQFSAIGANSDLLLHESTLEDVKLKDAIMKRHSTTAEAIQVGILMQSKKIILTHFSQRYRTFNGAEEVYSRLSDPKTRATVLSEMDSKGESPQFESFKELPVDSPDPIEIHSGIFDCVVNEECREQAPKTEVLFAIDNMHIVYGELAKQREVFEREGQNLETLFSNDKEGDDDIEEVEKKKGKKRKLNT